MSLFFINLESNSPNRFDPEYFFRYTDNFDPLTSSFVKDLKNLSQFGQYVVQVEEGRPDLISFKIYGDTQYWWIILLYNDIIYIEDIQIGMSLKFPSLSDLETIYFSLMAKQANA